MLMAGPAHAATLEVVVAGVRNNTGDIRVAVCSEQAFLKPTCEHVGHAPASAGEVVVRIPNVPSGVWAAQAFHDENRNGVIDKNLFGIPTEGLGFSNDAKIMFGPPDFAAAAFQLAPAGGRIRFALRYF
jgi:uncharacterized protein (DUF2141 family)